MNFMVTVRYRAVAVFCNDEILTAHFRRQTTPVKSLYIGKKPIIKYYIPGTHRYGNSLGQFNVLQIEIMVKRSSFGIVVFEVKHAGQCHNEKNNGHCPGAPSNDAFVC